MESRDNDLERLTTALHELLGILSELRESDPHRPKALKDLLATVIERGRLIDAEVFREPAADQQLFRYMDFAKFVEMLERGSLYCPSVEQLDDEFEGTYTEADLRMFTGVAEAIRRLDLEQKLGYDPIGALSLPWTYSRELRSEVCVTCWCVESHESFALWRMYTPGPYAVAVQSTFSRLKASLKNERIRFGTVQYLNYEADTIRRDHPFRPFMCKRTAFDFERELRGVFMRSRTESQSPSFGGEAVAVDLDSLIEEIRPSPVAPGWFVETVRAVCQRYGLRAKVRESEIRRPPTTLASSVR